MNRKKIGLLLIAIAGMVGASTSTFAVAGAPPAPSAFAIPASACEPIRPQDYAMVQLVAGYWRFKDLKNGRIKLRCPFPGGAIDTGGFGPGGFSDARVQIRDSDGALEAAHIKIKFQSRTGHILSTSAEFNSNVHGNTSQTGFRIESTGSTIGAQFIAVDTLAEFVVEMKRDRSDVSPQFAGINMNSFAPPPMYFFP